MRRFGHVPQRGFVGVLEGPKPSRANPRLELPEGPGDLTGMRKLGTGVSMRAHSLRLPVIVRGPTGTPKLLGLKLGFRPQAAQ